MLCSVATASQIRSGLCLLLSRWMGPSARSAATIAVISVCALLLASRFDATWVSAFDKRPPASTQQQPAALDPGPPQPLPSGDEERAPPAWLASAGAPGGGAAFFDFVETLVEQHCGRWSALFDAKALVRATIEAAVSKHVSPGEEFAPFVACEHE